MARERMVTRTIEVTKVTYLAMDITTQAVITNEFHFIGVAKDDNKILQAIKKAFETDTIKVVTITNKVTTEKLYGMPEWEFVEYAQELDPETRKTIE